MTASVATTSAGRLPFKRFEGSNIHSAPTNPLPTVEHACAISHHQTMTNPVDEQSAVTGPNALPVLDRARPTARRFLVRWLSSPISLAVVAFAIVLARRPATLLEAELWADDGMTLTQALQDGWATILQPLAGSLIVIQRVLVLPESWLPGPWMPVWGNAVSLIVTALTAAFLATRLPIAHPLRLAVAVGFVCLPFARDTWGTLCPHPVGNCDLPLCICVRRPASPTTPCRTCGSQGVLARLAIVPWTVVLSTRDMASALYRLRLCRIAVNCPAQQRTRADVHRSVGGAAGAHEPNHRVPPCRSGRIAHRRCCDCGADPPDSRPRGTVVLGVCDPGRRDPSSSGRDRRSTGTTVALLSPPVWSAPGDRSSFENSLDTRGCLDSPRNGHGHSIPFGDGAKNWLGDSIRVIGGPTACTVPVAPLGPIDWSVRWDPQWRSPT